MKRIRYDCVKCGKTTYDRRICGWCRLDTSLEETLKLLNDNPVTPSGKPIRHSVHSRQKKREVNKVRNCDVCEARKARRQKVMDVLFSAVKAGFGAAFQLGVSVGAIYYLIQEGVIL